MFTEQTATGAEQVFTRVHNMNMLCKHTQIGSDLGMTTNEFMMGWNVLRQTMIALAMKFLQYQMMQALEGYFCYCY